MHLDDDKKCKLQNEKCGHYCKHNESCSLLIVSPRVIKEVIDTTKNPDETCSIYKQAKEKYGPKICDSCDNEYDGGCLPPASKDNCIAYVEKKEKVSNLVQEFDYSAVDEETAEFLRKKANRINEIRIKSVVALGKELKEIQDKLANNKTGTFQAWVRSTGITPKTAYNYINAYDYIMKNFYNIEDAEELKPSLLFEVSKPSAPVELQQAVISGGIKTHKEYKELEARLKQTESELEEEVKLRQKAEQGLKDSKQAHIEKQNEIVRLKQKIEQLNNKLERAKESGNDKQVETLQEALRALDEEVTKLREERDKLQSQLKEKPIEIAAIKEVVPDWVIEKTANKLLRLFHSFNDFTREEVQQACRFCKNGKPAIELEDLQQAAEWLNLAKTIIVRR